MRNRHLRDRLRNLWLERLDSGADPQGMEYLARRVDGVWRYCCLGVACEVYQELVGTLPVEEGSGPRAYGGEIRYLPEEVVRAFGFRSLRGTDDVVLTWGTEEYDSLVDANDSGKLRFPDIAQLVRRHSSLVFQD